VPGIYAQGPGEQNKYRAERFLGIIIFQIRENLSTWQQTGMGAQVVSGTGGIPGLPLVGAVMGLV
jgi:hypothetical protein